MLESTSVLRAKTLMLCPSVGVWKIGGGLFFDRKFYDGMLAYADNWPGRVSLIIRLTTTLPPEFGLVQFNADIFPVKVVVINSDEKINSVHLVGVDILLASGDSFDSFHLSALCKRYGIKCVYVIEYTLETRLKIVAMRGVGNWKKLKQVLWLLLKERKRLRSFSLADGLQSNGVPAFDVYAKRVPNALLYFDTRNAASMSITDAELSARLDYLDAMAPLRLGFSGRLISMKGADHLVKIANQLQMRKVEFSFDIFGSGELFSQLEGEIERSGLSSIVKLHGAVDFSTELVPFVKSSLDLFVCCHKQSDPSCTYLETYACGVPIVGYKNHAHQGILNYKDVGWSVEMNDIDALADLITQLDLQRETIKIKARNAIIFAREHTFESTFQHRISHCIEILEG